MLKLYLIRLLFILLPHVVWAASYRVQIEAPGDLGQLLEHNLSLLRWQQREEIDLPQLERMYALAPQEIESLLAPQGYFKPQIKASMLPDKGAWLLRFEVAPGERVWIADVNLSVTGALRDEVDFQSRWAELIELWPLPMGDYFSQDSWDAAKRRGLQALLIDRFPAATIAHSEARIDPETGQAQLNVEYASGPRFSFGPLQTEGLQRYPAEVVTRLNDIEVGSPYSQQKLQDFQSALQNTLYFSSVLLDMNLDPEHPEQVPLQLELVEAKRRKVDLGLGYDTDKGPKASLQYRDINLRGLGWIGKTNLSWQEGKQTASFALEAPPNRNGYRYSSILQGEGEQSNGLDKTTLSLGAQRSRLKGLIELTQALQYQHSREVVQEAPEKLRRALTLTQSWTRRELDNPADPRKGLLFSWQLGGASRALLSDTDFLRLWGRAALYHPVGAKGRLVLRGEAGEVIAQNIDAVPIDWLFRSGGAGSVRGYAYQTLGVKKDNAVLGGDVLAVLSAEYQHAIVGPWRAALFVDSGNAKRGWHEFNFKTGAGVGIRWSSPVGSLAVDIAYGFAERKTRPHFSLGLGF